MRKIGLLLLCLFGTTVFAQNKSAAEPSADPRVEILGDTYQSVSGVAATQSRIVVYRLADSQRPGVTSVLVNGSYHASLLKGAWTDLCLSPASVQFTLRQPGAGQAARQHTTAFPLSLQAGRTHYLQVVDGADAPVMQSVSAEQAERELPNTRKQLHTLSRAAQACEPVAPAATN